MAALFACADSFVQNSQSELTMNKSGNETETDYRKSFKDKS
jgi:hypothetical protein